LDEQGLRAKELFTQYVGSHFHMHREGDLEEYKKYTIAKETEMEWFREMIAKYTAQLSIRDWEAVNRLDSISNMYQDSTLLKNVVAFAARNVLSSDSMVRVMYAEGITRIIRSSKKVIPQDAFHDACKVVVRLLEDVVSGPLVLDPGHELAQLGLTDKKSLNKRAMRGIDEIKALL
jgi:hypothetical protein